VTKDRPDPTWDATAATWLVDIGALSGLARWRWRRPTWCCVVSTLVGVGEGPCQHDRVRYLFLAAALLYLAIMTVGVLGGRRRRGGWRRGRRSPD
jgi:hypothetical protein